MDDQELSEIAARDYAAYYEQQRYERRQVEVRAIRAQINALGIDEHLRSVLHGLLNLSDEDYGRD